MLKKRFFGALAVATLLTLSFGTPVMAQSGSAVFTNEGVTPFAISYPGGGTWDTGTKTSGAQKHVWSHYLHPDNCHSATAKLDTQTEKDVKSAGSWAKADVYGNPSYTGYTFWDNNATGCSK